VRVPPRIDFANACDRPEYPMAARRSEATGTVIVVYTADTTGATTEATIEKSAGSTREHKMLDRSTLEAVRACKVVPGTVDGKPEKLSGRVTYVWRLE
jgi:protein TonB